MNRRFVAIFGFGILFGLQTMIAMAEDLNPLGRPKNFKEGESSSYAIWVENGLWKLQTTSFDSKSKNKKQKNNGVIFEGSVRVEGGKMSGGRGSVEKAKNLNNADRIDELPNGQGFTFRFATFGKVDSVDWTLDDKVTALHFKLLINGKEDPGRIFIGGKSIHPEKGEFTIHLPLPEEKKGKKGKEKKK